MLLDQFPAVRTWQATLIGAAAQKVVDGTTQVRGHHVRSIVVGQQPNNSSWATWDGQAQGDIELDVRFRAFDLELRRQFLLPRFASIELSTAAYSNITLWARDRAIGSIYAGPTIIQMTGSEEPANPSRVNRGLWCTTPTPGAPYATPAGARTVTPISADPAFEWRLLGTPGITLPLAQTPGATYPVLGTRFVCSVVQTLIWEIEV